MNKLHLVLTYRRATKTTVETLANTSQFTTEEEAEKAAERKAQANPPASYRIVLATAHPIAEYARTVSCIPY